MISKTLKSKKEYVKPPFVKSLKIMQIVINLNVNTAYLPSSKLSKFTFMN